MKKRARARERMTKAFGWMFQGLSGDEILKAITRSLYGRYRSRRPVEQDTRPVPF